MDIISTLLSIAMIITGIIGLIISGGDWLGVDIICIKRHQENGDYDF